MTLSLLFFDALHKNNLGMLTAGKAHALPLTAFLPDSRSIHCWMPGSSKCPLYGRRITTLA